ncbi:Sorting nexin-16 [Saguinus oedipus]|uniref:Sorting nexin-16 n=1 Tax=Saguinus oedipus TaxID=9490 RepID=A0ABQ9UEZ5_SAGOE|nr:Sorting nexin-16 [Saguinus oedipus]
MATPYVPVPMPIGNSASSFTNNRNQRSSSFGSVSTSSNSSKGQLEDSNMGNFKQTSVPDQMENTSSVCSSPLIRTKFTGAASSIEYSTRGRETEEQNPETVNWEDRPSTPTILGYEVMEERAKFTDCAQKKPSAEEVRGQSHEQVLECTELIRVGATKQEMFPGFRLALPPKRWFKDNYNADFLEDRQLGLQAFLQNLVAHKDIANCDAAIKIEFEGIDCFLYHLNLVEAEEILAVREFLCLDDPPGPFDSLEESRLRFSWLPLPTFNNDQLHIHFSTLEGYCILTSGTLAYYYMSSEKELAFCETLEETNYRLQKELLEKQKEMESLKKLLNEKQLHIDTLEKRFRTMSLEPKESLDMSETEGEQILKVESSVLEVDQDILEEESRADNKPCLSFSELEHAVSEIEVAEVAYNAED